uniref:Uncharacterized protein n=1 Tax=Dunaliella tertiolecta TaxID=3047 RepID=A0A7S3R5E6_DUNTE
MHGACMGPNPSSPPFRPSHSTSPALPLKYNPSFGIWEKQVLGDWANIGRTQPEYEAVQFKQAFRMSKPAFKTLCETYCASLAKQDTHMRSAIPVEKRLAIFFCTGLAQVLFITTLRRFMILVSLPWSI